MKKYLSALALAIAVVLSGCSSSGSDNDTTGGTTGGGTTGGTTTGNGTGGTTTNGGSVGVTDAGPVEPSGDIVGVWFGDNNYGDAVMIIDANSNIAALAANGSGQFETVFGPASEQLQRFIHRNTDNPAFADSFTLAGDLPSALDANDPDSIVYILETGADGQSINNAVTGSEFSMTFATANDLPSISPASIAGDWVARTAFCADPPEGCNLTLQMTITADGTVTGSTEIGGGMEPITQGSVNVAAGATQYLNVAFTWTEKRRTGVLYADRNDPTRLILNTFGPSDEEGISSSFSAQLTRQ